MQNSDMPAMPISNDELASSLELGADGSKGLTKREYAAIKIMAGFASDPDTAGTVGEISKYAVKWADALLKELDK